MRAELERILVSRRFRKAERTSRLLCFLAQHSVIGRKIDEHAVAAEVFGRPATFVPQIDPVVRVELRRLRDALRLYYAGEGRKNPLLLEAPDRGYELVFWDSAEGYVSHRRRRRVVPAVLLTVLAVSAAAWLYLRPHHLDPEAVRLDKRARYLRAQGSPEDVARSLVAFQQSVERDSSYSASWSGLADLLCSTGAHGGMTREEAMARARDAANRAIRLDGRNAEAHGALAYIQFLENWNWTAAEAEFRRAIGLNPSAPEVHRRYAQCLLSRGRFDEAIAESKTAVDLEPSDAPPSTDLAEILCSAHRYNEGLAEARRVVQETGGAPSARVALGVCLTAQGRYDEAIAEYQIAVRASRSTYAMARLGHVYGVKGDHATAYAILERLDEYFGRTVAIYWSYRAMVYAGLGEAARAVDSLEKAYAAREGDINFIGVDPAYDRIHTEGPFMLFRNRLGLP